MRKTAIEELALRTVDALQTYGLMPFTAWDAYRHSYVPIIKAHIMRDRKEFDREIVTEYVRQIEERFKNGEIKTGRYRTLKRAAQRLTEMHDTGKLSWTAPEKKTGYRLNEYYEYIVTEFVSSGQFSAKGQSDAIWIGRKYCSWLLQDGHNDFSDVGADEIQRFMIYCSQHMKGTSVHNVKLYMKKLYRHLAQSGYSPVDHAGLFEFAVSRESRMFPALPPEEIVQMLEMINLYTPKGKRDYAIILLGVVTGLRAGDIAKLRLSDIDWRTGEIKLVQAKTGKSLALPLTKDVGEAIRDYILNGRQETNSDALFLRVHAPFQGLANGVAIECMYNYYRKRSGLPRDAFDGKGFHALRRSLGRNLVTSGTNVTLVAQLLGHEDINSTKKYISLDSMHLKECALGLNGIEPEGDIHNA
jgi:integrase